MKTILDIINLGEDFLKNKGFERARREAEELIADALTLRRIDLYLNHDRPLNPKELEKCRSFFSRRAKKEPPQYILGEVSFAGVKIKVNPNVLIPRPETEILVEKIAESLKDISLQGKVLVDMCTGSGCIGIALKKRFPELNVILVDVSAAALKVASENALLNDVKVVLIESDLFTNLEGDFDFFVCNPPYVTEKEYLTLAPELHFEPKIALVGGQDGLAFYQKISEVLFSRIKDSAWLEIGKDQGRAVLDLFKKNNWTQSQIEKDWSGHDRFLILKK